MLQLMIKVDDRTKVLMTPMGPQIWMKEMTVPGVNSDCPVCRKAIGAEPFYVPMAGPVLLNPEDRIHETCADTLDLLPMQTNHFVEEGIFV